MKGELTSLKISENKSLLYQLFADDAGMFLSNLWDGDGLWRTTASFRESSRITRQGGDPGLVWLLYNISPLATPADSMLL